MFEGYQKPKGSVNFSQQRVDGAAAATAAAAAIRNVSFQRSKIDNPKKLFIFSEVRGMKMS